MHELVGQVQFLVFEKITSGYLHKIALDVRNFFHVYYNTCEGACRTVSIQRNAVYKIIQVFESGYIKSLKTSKKKTSRGKNAVNSLIPNELAFKKRLDLNTENVAHAEIVRVTNVHDVFSNLSSLQQSARALVARHSCYGLSSYQQEYI